MDTTDNASKGPHKEWLSTQPIPVVLPSAKQGSSTIPRNAKRPLVEQLDLSCATQLALLVPSMNEDNRTPRSYGAVVETFSTSIPSAPGSLYSFNSQDHPSHPQQDEQPIPLAQPRRYPPAQHIIVPMWSRKKGKGRSTKSRENRRSPYEARQQMAITSREMEHAPGPGSGEKKLPRPGRQAGSELCSSAGDGDPE